MGSYSLNMLVSCDWHSFGDSSNLQQANRWHLVEAYVILIGIAMQMGLGSALWVRAAHPGTRLHRASTTVTIVLKCQGCEYT